MKSSVIITLLQLTLATSYALGKEWNMADEMVRRTKELMLTANPTAASAAPTSPSSLSLSLSKPKSGCVTEVKADFGIDDFLQMNNNGFTHGCGIYFKDDVISCSDYPTFPIASNEDQQDSREYLAQMEKKCACVRREFSITTGYDGQCTSPEKPESIFSRITSKKDTSRSLIELESKKIYKEVLKHTICDKLSPLNQAFKSLPLEYQKGYFSCLSSSPKNGASAPTSMKGLITNFIKNNLHCEKGSEEIFNNEKDMQEITACIGEGSELNLNAPAEGTANCYSNSELQIFSAIPETKHLDELKKRIEALELNQESMQQLAEDLNKPELKSIQGNMLLLSYLQPLLTADKNDPKGFQEIKDQITAYLNQAKKLNGAAVDNLLVPSKDDGQKLIAHYTTPTAFPSMQKLFDKSRSHDDLLCTGIQDGLNDLVCNKNDDNFEFANFYLEKLNSQKNSIYSAAAYCSWAERKIEPANGRAFERKIPKIFAKNLTDFLRKALETKESIKEDWKKDLGGYCAEFNKWRKDQKSANCQAYAKALKDNKFDESSSLSQSKCRDEFNSSTLYAAGLIFDAKKKNLLIVFNSTINQASSKASSSNANVNILSQPSFSPHEPDGNKSVDRVYVSQMGPSPQDPGVVYSPQIETKTGQETSSPVQQKFENASTNLDDVNNAPQNQMKSFSTALGGSPTPTPQVISPAPVAATSGAENKKLDPNLDMQNRLQNLEKQIAEKNINKDWETTNKLLNDTLKENEGLKTKLAKADEEKMSGGASTAKSKKSKVVKNKPEVLEEDINDDFEATNEQLDRLNNQKTPAQVSNFQAINSAMGNQAVPTPNSGDLQSSGNGSANTTVNSPVPTVAINPQQKQPSTLQANGQKGISAPSTQDSTSSLGSESLKLTDAAKSGITYATAPEGVAIDDLSEEILTKAGELPKNKFFDWIKTKLKIEKNAKEIIVSDGLKELHVTLDSRGESVIPELKTFSLEQPKKSSLDPALIQRAPANSPRDKSLQDLQQNLQKIK